MVSDFAPTGALKAYLLQGKTDGALASYITEEVRHAHILDVYFSPTII